MYKNRKIIALIPARGGSKGIKLKNLKKIKNKTLIGHVADFVNKSKIFDISIVSTDNNKIKKEAIKNKLKIIHRPRKLAGNKISDIQVITHSLKNLPKYNYKNFDYLVYLQPTSPNRQVNHFLHALNKVIKNKFSGSWSVTKIDKKFHPLKILKLNQNKIELFDKRGKKIIARQMLGDVFIRNGLFYIFSIEKLIRYKTIYLKNMYPALTNFEIANIDNLDDLFKSKKLMN